MAGVQVTGPRKYWTTGDESTSFRARAPPDFLISSDGESEVRLLRWNQDTSPIDGWKPVSLGLDTRRRCGSHRLTVTFTATGAIFPGIFKVARRSRDEMVTLALMEIFQSNASPFVDRMV